MGTILLGIAAWFGVAGIIGVGWARFHRRVGSMPLPPGLQERETAA
jgi:hypothetical protein